MTKMADDLGNVLLQMDEQFGPLSRGYSDAIVMLASLSTGLTDEGKLAELLEFDPEYVALVGNRLRNTGIWKGAALDSAAIARWNEEETGGLSFFMDVNVAVGDFTMTYQDDGEPRYKMTESARRHVESMLRK